MSAEVLKPVTIKKIYPLASELSSINNKVQCTEEGCDSIFTSESNLLMHMVKCHERKELTLKNDKIILHHHCPEITCIYHAIRHFKKLKYLKQHYLKVHAERNYFCETCNKGFSTSAIKNSHSEICGVIFTCLQCPNTYTSYESLITHGRRKNHSISDRSVFIKSNKTGKSKISNHNYKTKVYNNNNNTKLILPKQNVSMQTTNFIPIILQIKEATSSLNFIDKQIQTEPYVVKNNNNKIKSSLKRRSNICTQTCTKKRTRISIETQTTGDCILKRAIQDAKLLNIKDTIDEHHSRKCIETQTQKWPNIGDISTQTDIDTDSDINLDSLSSDIISSSSQTSVNTLNFFDDTFGNCQETQTDILYQDDFLQSSSYIAHIETQTNDDIDLCNTNMYTQTCDDQLLSDFSNIQTQTNWPDYDLFVSTETQTLLTQNTKSFFDLPMSAREISHMETQTDMEFKQLLEEINA